MKQVVLADSVAVLTRRQFEVLEVTAQGMTMAQAAHRLGIGRETVRTHRAAICRVLEAPNITAAVRIACKGGLL